MSKRDLGTLMRYDAVSTSSGGDYDEDDEERKEPVRKTPPLILPPLGKHIPAPEVVPPHLRGTTIPLPAIRHAIAATAREKAVILEPPPPALPPPIVMPSCVTGVISDYFTEQSVLGKGGFGRVFVAKPTKEGARLLKTSGKKVPSLVAIKEISIVETESIATEIHFLSKLSFEHCVQYYGCIEQPGKHVYLVMEYFKGVSLHVLLATSHPSDYILLRLLASVARALDELHQMGIVHRDVKPDNILVDSKFKVKLIDYGLACDSFERKGFCETSIVGTRRYLDPHRGPLDDADWWSYGQTMCEIFLGHTMFNKETGRFRVLSIEEVFLFPKQIQKLVRALTNPSISPDDRPHYDKILKVMGKL